MGVCKTIVSNDANETLLFALANEPPSILIFNISNKTLWSINKIYNLTVVKAFWDCNNRNLTEKYLISDF